MWELKPRHVHENLFSVAKWIHSFYEEKLRTRAHWWLTCRLMLTLPWRFCSCASCSELSSSCLGGWPGTWICTSCRPPLTAAGWEWKERTCTGSVTADVTSYWFEWNHWNRIFWKYFSTQVQVHVPHMANTINSQTLSKSYNCIYANKSYNSIDTTAKACLSKSYIGYRYK